MRKGRRIGRRARTPSRRVLPNGPAPVRVRDVNHYGHLVGEVILADGRNLNHELVHVGLAWWYRRYAPEDRLLGRLEREAREARRGLWADRNPVPPWLWRELQSGTIAIPWEVVSQTRTSKGQSRDQGEL